MKYISSTSTKQVNLSGKSVATIKDAIRLNMLTKDAFDGARMDAFVTLRGSFARYLENVQALEAGAEKNVEKLQSSKCMILFPLSFGGSLVTLFCYSDDPVGIEEV